MRTDFRPTVTVLTHLTSPYQVELFDAVAVNGGCRLFVIYMMASSRARLWGRRAIAHEHVVMDTASDASIDERTLSADLTVFNYYNDRRVLPLLGRRALSGTPWTLWGERPGFRRPNWLGQRYRRWALADLLESDAPVWGIGRFALERYRLEFGGTRSYVNLPYFSDLKRFRVERVSARVHPGQTTFLFSGSLVARKGVDLLARAFLALVASGADVRLRIMGSGELEPFLRNALRQVSQLVEFIGFRDWDCLPKEYWAADVLCVPSRHDGWALVVPEGLASGMPIIGTDQTGAALEFVRPRSNGWIVPAGDWEALFRAMADAAGLSDRDLRRSSNAAVNSVAHHTLMEGAERFTAAALSALACWGRGRATDSTMSTGGDD